MLKNIFYIVLFFSLFAQAQNRYVYEFEKMHVVSKTDAEVEKLREDEATLVKDANLFYTDNCLTNGIISSAIGYRKGKHWTVYETPFGGNGRANVGFTGYSDNREYAFFEMRYAAGSNSHEVESTEFYIIDLVNGSCTGFSKDQQLHTWEYPVGDTDDIITEDFSSVNTQIIVNGNMFTVMEVTFSTSAEEKTEYEEEAYRQYGNYDANSGIYQIQGQKLVKTFYYDADSLRMMPVLYAGTMAAGMVLRDIPDVYGQYSNNVELKEVPRYTYGDDSDELGYELWFEEKLQYFLTVADKKDGVKRITGLTVISPEIEVGGLHTGLGIGEILKRYPNAKLNIDLINDWEYLYIKELSLRLEFKTSETNRIAQYTYNKRIGSYEAVKIKDEKRKLDFISVK